MPSGRVKWFDPERGFGFLSRDDGGDVFVHKAALPAGVTELKPGDKVEFGVAEGRRGEQALSVQILAASPRLAAKAEPEKPRRDPQELHGMIEDMIQVLDTVQRELRRGKHPDKKVASKVAKIVHAVADELDA